MRFYRTLAIWLLIILLLAFVGWRVRRAMTGPVLWPDTGFETTGLDRWQVIEAGGAQATLQPAPDEPNNRLLLLQLPGGQVGSGAGVGRQAAVGPRQRYRLTLDYRALAGELASVQPLVRIIQLDRAGEPIKSEEILLTTATQEAPPWQQLGYTFITAEGAVRLEAGMGFFGQEAASVGVDNFALRPYPPPFYALTHDTPALVGLGLAGLLAGYSLGRTLWPVRRRLLVNGALAVGGVVAALLLAEGAARLMPFRLLGPAWPPGYHVPLQEGYSYRLAHNYPATVITTEYGDKNVVVGNSLGLRDVEIPENQAVVLVLGDSMTFGVVGEVADSWPRLLDKAVAELVPGPERYHFVNAGVTGYNTYQEVMLLKELLPEMEGRGVKPEVVMLSFFSRIWGRNLYGPEGRFTVMNDVVMYSSVKRTIWDLPAWLIKRSQADDLKLLDPRPVTGLHQALLDRSRLYFILILLLTLRFDEDWDARPPVDPVAANYAALESFKAVAEAHHVEPVVVYLPGHYLFEPEVRAEAQAQVEELAGVCGRLGLPFINPSEAMARLGITGENAARQLTMGYDSHYSVAGNRLYARALAPLVVDYLAAPEQP